MKRKFASLVFILSLSGIASARADEIQPAGKLLAAKLDAMDVEHHWLPGKVVAWKTGNPLKEGTIAKGHTHCSAFAAEACRRLGVYILRPPEHATTLLANAQYDWLFNAGKKEGWSQVHDGQRAQHLANEGNIVVAVFKECDPQRPGHVAIVRPSVKSAERIQAEGPQIIQAGAQNARSTSLRTGFSHHPAAWSQQKVRYFAHKVNLGK